MTARTKLVAGVGAFAVMGTALAMYLAFSNPLPLQVIRAMPVTLADGGTVLVSLWGANPDAKTSRLMGHDPATGATLWSRTLRYSHPDPEGLTAVGDVVVVAIYRPSASRMALSAFAGSDGSERWTLRADVGFDALWSHRATVVARFSDDTSDDLDPLLGVDAATGRELWRTGPLPRLEEPIFVGDHLLLSVARRERPGLAVIDLKSGGRRDLGGGLQWPGIVHDDRYVTTFLASGSGDALVDAATLDALKRGGPLPTPPPATGPAILATTLPSPTPTPRGVPLVALDPVTAEITPIGVGGSTVHLPPGCDRWGMIALGRDRAFCDLDGVSLHSEPLTADRARYRVSAEEPWRLWDLGALALGREEDFTRITSAFVPVVLNGPHDDSRLCVLDVDAGLLPWCSGEMQEPDVGIFGWANLAAAGDAFLVHLSWPDATPLWERESVLVVMDAATGLFRGALQLQPQQQGALVGFPTLDAPFTVHGDRLIGWWGSHLFCLDLRTMQLVWHLGPVPLMAGDGIAVAERFLGPLPR